MSAAAKRQRIGLLGGTFDPIHIGHLLMGEFARERLELDQLRYIPAAQAPHKLEHIAVDSKHRMEMVQLAINGNRRFIADDRELQRGGTSFTVDTLSELASHGDELFFIMGADSLADFHTWKQPERICELAFVAVIARGGQPLPDLSQLARYLPADQRAAIAEHLIEMPQMDISSTAIRTRLAAGQSIRYQVPAAVGAYIRANHLYGT